MKEQLEALIAELDRVCAACDVAYEAWKADQRSDALWAEYTSAQRTASDILRVRLPTLKEALLAADAGGWRPIAEMPADGSVWRSRDGGAEGFVRADRSNWTQRVSYRVVTISPHGGWTMALGFTDWSGAMVAPLPEPSPQEPPR